MVTPAGAAIFESVAKCCRARISVGAISTAWPPASTAASIDISATSRLSRADIALQQPQHPLRSRHVLQDLADRRRLAGGQRKGQGVAHWLAEFAGCMHRRARDLAQSLADQRQG